MILLLLSFCYRRLPSGAQRACVRARKGKRVELATIEGQMQFMQLLTDHPGPSSPSTITRAQKGQRCAAQAPT